MTPTKTACALLAALLVTAAAGDEPGRYRVGPSNGPSCVIAPCPSTRITDRTTGVTFYADLAFDLSPADAPTTAIPAPDWDLLVDGEIRQDASTRNVAVLHITKILGRTPRQ